MNNFHPLIEGLAREFGLPKPVFTHWDTKSVCGMDPCSPVTTYFTDSIPANTLDFGVLRLLSPEHLTQENEELIPGCNAAPYGLVTWAATDCGDSVSVDLITGETFLIGANVIEEEMICPGWKPDLSGFQDLIPITRENLISVSQKRWPDIGTALTSLLTEEDPPNDPTMES